MFHAGVEVAGEEVLDQEGREVECPQHQLLRPLGLGPGLVAGQHPGPGLADRGGLEDFITEVENNINPVVQLTFT